jgi:HD-GYP domain-containing protein (c-di-GMP phosphodiesterase class II)/pSer/pThr/pTyr-binding forkhead associated (FHA) protein
MSEPRIVLSGMGPKLSGLTWESSKLLRIGRQTNLDVVLRDNSVERVHAEVRNHGMRWLLRDLARNLMYPTLVNNQSLHGKDYALKVDDVVQIGRLQLRVIEAAVEEEPPALTRTPLPAALNSVNGGIDRGKKIMVSGVHVTVKAKTQQSWEQALELATFDAPSRPQQVQAMLALVRANHHMTHISHLEELLRSILTDTTAALNAQRGSIILADPITGELALKATYAPNLGPGTPAKPFSKTLVKRCFELGESFLCEDINADESLVLARSVRHGAMASIITALLRTPRKRIGILHLDRGFLEEPFNESDLYYADAIAASVAVGIETAQLVEHQREQFIETVSTLARAVEMRDQYSGVHTRRVTDYSLLLADELRLQPNEKYQIQIGAPLRDIGKIGIDDAILRKPGKLTVGEFEAMKTHTTKGATMLDSMRHLVPMIPIVRHHHERWDGTGYPDHLAHDQIPQIARIVAVADAFDAMTSDRPYRPALPADQAFLELVSKAGTHFDPNCVYAFMRLRHKIEAMMQQS